ncbi:MAG: SpoIIIAH-like family protein [Angelakisella sp.]
MKMRMNMILSKKHIILSALVIALSIAIYLNWEYVRNNSGDFINTAGLAASVAANGTEAEAAAYGEAYFAEAKLSRTKSRDEAVDALKYMLEDAHLSTVQMKELTTQATKLALSIEREGKIENLIKAKGFADCMVYLDAEKIDVLVKCSNLTDSEAAQIKDVILGEVTLPDEKISIIEIK